MINLAKFRRSKLVSPMFGNTCGGKVAKLKPGMRFEMVYKKLRASLEVTADAFVVKAGSQFPVAVQEEFAKNHPGSAAIPEQLLASGAVVQKSPAVLEAARDIPFSAPSTASSVLRGGPGERTHWKGGPENYSAVGNIGDGRSAKE